MSSTHRQERDKAKSQPFEKRTKYSEIGMIAGREKGGSIPKLTFNYTDMIMMGLFSFRFG